MSTPTPLAVAAQKVARWLDGRRDALVDGWVRELADIDPPVARDLRAWCTDGVATLLGRFSRGELEELLADEARQAGEAARAGRSFQPLVLAMAAFQRATVPALVEACADRGDLAEALVAVHEVTERRLEVLLRAQEHELTRRVTEAEEHAARTAERARELARINDELRRSEARSQHRAEQVGLLGNVAHRIAGILDPERLMQEAAEAIQSRMNYTYVAVVVLDDEGVLVGRWAGRQGVGRRSSGRAQGPAGGVIGRALRKRAPQVVGDVSRDSDYHADVPGTHSEMVIPLLENGEAIGAIDFQAERAMAFDLDDVAVGETIAEFLVVALRNARLYAEARRERA
jgi:putative methionine-R-sulfoxide reductase with GAF domain